MKSIALILTASILFLAFRPGIELLSFGHQAEVICCSDSCITLSSEDNTADQQKSDPCTGNDCNPFQSCGINSVLIHFEYVIGAESMMLKSKSNFTYQFNIHSQCLTDFWQPPRFV